MTLTAAAVPAVALLAEHTNTAPGSADAATELAEVFASKAGQDFQTHLPLSGRAHSTPLQSRLKPRSIMLSQEVDSVRPTHTKCVEVNSVQRS